MSKHQRDLTIEKLSDKIKTYITDERELSVIDKAYKYAFDKHFGQKRLTGEDYIIHPLNVAYILTRINADYETLSAALLHDVVEDCNVSVDDIEKVFGHILQFWLMELLKLINLIYLVQPKYLLIIKGKYLLVCRRMLG